MAYRSIMSQVMAEYRRPAEAATRVAEPAGGDLDARGEPLQAVAAGAPYDAGLSSALGVCRQPARADKCRLCGHSRWWYKEDGTRICETCHPRPGTPGQPASAAGDGAGRDGPHEATPGRQEALPLA